MYLLVATLNTYKDDKPIQERMRRTGQRWRHSAPYIYKGFIEPSCGWSPQDHWKFVRIMRVMVGPEYLKDGETLT